MSDDNNQNSSQSNTNTYYKRKHWDEQEKTTLLRALKKYGYKDIENIAKEFPYKTPAAVRTMINKLHLAAKKNSTVKKVQLDEWLKSGYFNNTDTMIPEALKIISEVEDHPLREQSADCDFMALYDLLHRITQGQPAVDVTQMTVETLLYTLNQVTHEVWPSCETQAYAYVEKLEQSKSRKVYPPHRSRRINNTS
ncbi:uncharacterized protein LOC123267582 [Cotesia glomerata]|uniref:uncharacterized protein LOC123267582 n=1 Tax=Cotesia glomerata TaxID=32391 RepID=UPI001D0343A7|nr:uncharacterized protein LOC123267582 [Cotesia glomerata]